MKTRTSQTFPKVRTSVPPKTLSREEKDQQRAGRASPGHTESPPVSAKRQQARFNDGQKIRAGASLTELLSG